MKNKLNFLLVLALLLGLTLACVDDDDSDTSEQFTQQQETEDVSYDTPKVEPNNGDDFWQNSGNPLYMEGEDGIELLTEQNRSDLLEDVKRFQLGLKQDESSEHYNLGIKSTLEELIPRYGELAFDDKKYLAYTIELIHEGLGYKLEPEDIGDTLLLLLVKYPDNKKLKSLLPQLKNSYLKSLRVNQYNPKIRYLKEKQWQDVYSEGTYFSTEYFPALAKIGELQGDKKEQAFWLTRLADYYMLPHYYDDKEGGNEPRWSYDLYLKAGNRKEAQGAAIAAGDRFLEVYLNGERSNMGYLARDAFLPYDLEQAKQWYKTGGLNGGFATSRMKQLVQKSMDTSCSTRGDCSAEEQQLLERKQSFAKSL